MKETILLHTCCAPCFCYVAIELQQTYKIEAFYYNPNIFPQEEYQRRLDELRNYTLTQGLSLKVGEYEPEIWEPLISDYKDLGERSERCWQCYKMRLEKSFQYAKNNNIQIITTVLSISPHKNAKKINEIGKELEEKYSIKFLEADFKKNDGFKQSIQMSEQFGFYRQNYCGCIYSKQERERKL